MAEANAQVAIQAGEGRAGVTGSLPARSVTSSPPRLLEEHPAWPTLARMPTVLSVNIPLRGFRVCHLLVLQAGHTIASAWSVKEDVPLKLGKLDVCWGEFEVVEQQMALRLTRLA